TALAATDVGRRVRFGIGPLGAGWATGCGLRAGARVLIHGVGPGGGAGRSCIAQADRSSGRMRAERDAAPTSWTQPVAVADPRVIVLGGGLMASGRLLPRLVTERWPAVRPAWAAAGLRLSRLGADAGLYGAALLAAQLTASLHRRQRAARG